MTKTLIPAVLFIAAIIVLGGWLTQYRLTADACFASDACIERVTP